VIQYVSYGDSKDRSSGHGTHVAGTIAGSSDGIDSNNLKHGGHAPGAKIAFFDMEDSSHPENGIIYPSPIGDYVFQAAYDAGARFHSNSWGSSFNFYDSDTISIDNFHNVYPDFLAIFAAGNDGAKGFYSVGSPAVSKNAITVGATRSDSANEIDRVAYFSSLGPTFDQRIKVRWSHLFSSCL
jgi:serine protease AprX